MEGTKPICKNKLFFLHASNKLEVKEIKKTITTVTKRIKYTGVNLTKEVRDLYDKNHKTLLKEIKKERYARHMSLKNKHS